MRLELELTLVPTQSIHPVEIRPKDGPPVLVQARPVQVRTEYQLDYHHLPESVPVLSVGRIPVGSGTRIQIQSCRINGQPWSDHSGLFCLQVRDTPFVQNHTQEHTWEIAYSGRLELQVQANRDRLCWCPAYHSDRRSDWVFDNTLAHWPQVRPEVRRWGMDPRPRSESWQNLPHLPQDPATWYEQAVFGCSVTWGTAMRLEDTWSHQITDSTLNLAVPGSGWDAVWLNLCAADRKFRWGRTICLLPNLQRQVIRVPVRMTGGWARLCLGSHNLDWFQTVFKEWAWRNAGTLHTEQEIQGWRQAWESQAFRIIARPAHTERRARRVLSLIQRTLAAQGRPYWISSWDPEAYTVLSEHTDPQHLLPPFPQWVDRAEDDRHPGPRTHRLWAEQIRPIID
jgi:hypothetical protein